MSQIVAMLQYQPDTTEQRSVLAARKVKECYFMSCDHVVELEV